MTVSGGFVLKPYPVLLVAIGLLFLPWSASGEPLDQAPERGPASIEPGADVGHSPRARWTHDGGLALQGAAGATLQVDHAIMLRIRASVSMVHIMVAGAPSPWVHSYVFEVHRNGTRLGVLDATAPHAQLDFTNVTAGDFDISATLSLAEDAPPDGLAMSVFSVESVA